MKFKRSLLSILVKEAPLIKELILFFLYRGLGAHQDEFMESWDSDYMLI